jgi:hypothetical protein
VTVRVWFCCGGRQILYTATFVLTQPLATPSTLEHSPLAETRHISHAGRATSILSRYLECNPRIRDAQNLNFVTPVIESMRSGHWHRDFQVADYYGMYSIDRALRLGARTGLCANAESYSCKSVLVT